MEIDTNVTLKLVIEIDRRWNSDDFESVIRSMRTLINYVEFIKDYDDDPSRVLNIVRMHRVRNRSVALLMKKPIVIKSIQYNSPGIIVFSTSSVLIYGIIQLIKHYFPNKAARTKQEILDQQLNSMKIRDLERILSMKSKDLSTDLKKVKETALKEIERLIKKGKITDIHDE